MFPKRSLYLPISSNWRTLRASLLTTLLLLLLLDNKKIKFNIHSQAWIHAHLFAWSSNLWLSNSLTPPPDLLVRASTLRQPRASASSRSRTSPHKQPSCLSAHLKTTPHRSPPRLRWASTSTPPLSAAFRTNPSPSECPSTRAAWAARAGSARASCLAGSMSSSTSLGLTLSPLSSVMGGWNSGASRINPPLGFTWRSVLNRIPGSSSSSAVSRSVVPWFSKFRGISDNPFSVASSALTETQDQGNFTFYIFSFSCKLNFCYSWLVW